MLKFFAQLTIFSFLIFLVMISPLFTYKGTLSILIEQFKNMSNLMFQSKALKALYVTLFGLLLMVNFGGNNPLSMVPTMLYSVTVSISLVIWLTLITTSMMSNYYETLSHLMPFGTPTGLMILLPLIEILSQILRPFTLAIRMSTNLAAGHILVFIFSFFMLSMNSVGVISLGAVVALLQLLELGISLLQSYIFVTLIVMYTEETQF